MAENEKVKIYLRLDEEMSKRFLLVKKYLGLKNDTEVLRCLLADFWNKHHKKIQAKKEKRR